MGTKKSKRTTQGTIIITLLILAIVGYYCYLVNRSNDSSTSKTLTAVENVLLRDLSTNYPPSPKEVVKYYSDIMKCFYNEECTENEVESLASKARELFDEELNDYNEWGSYIISLKDEIKEYKDNKRRVSSYSVASSTDVDYFTADGYSFARLRCSYNVIQGKETESIMQVYLLRKDVENHWKIYGWDLAENLTIYQ